jgi:carbamoylphosphate synthase small subunit
VVAHAAAAYPFKKKDARLVLEDGSVWHGTSFGATGTEIGEVVFNTSITGYQEIMTDPSYKGQFVCFTHPHIGNVGINDGAQGRVQQDRAQQHMTVGARAAHSNSACSSNSSSSMVPLYAVMQQLCK